jgi:hypothetical protein
MPRRCATPPSVPECLRLHRQRDPERSRQQQSARKPYRAEETILIVLAGLRGEDCIAELCRREGIAENLSYSRSKGFLEAG